MPSHIGQNARFLDLSQRIVGSTSVVASPTGAAEAVIASIALPAGLSYAAGVALVGQVGYTVGATGASGRVRIRQNSVTGPVVADTGAVTETPANVDNHVAVGFDTAPVDAGVYKLTLTVASAVTASPVGACGLLAVAV